MQHCPNCRARYREGSTCRRCGMELELLLKSEQASQYYLTAGICAMATNDRHVAMAHLKRAYQLTHDPLASALLGFCKQ
ncbi:hypothetical protein VRRI112168_15690 [Vreelandella rituensis]|uniref:hypothetical protein n=1 Tax=Vreelandella rituensis TaxID=2282306 RepID=UPI0011C0320B|nr:hypothetical protein [Halomonas rituensis]